MHDLGRGLRVRGCDMDVEFAVGERKSKLLFSCFWCLLTFAHSHRAAGDARQVRAAALAAAPPPAPLPLALALAFPPPQVVHTRESRLCPP